MRGLAEAGHEVTVVSHFPDKNPAEGYTDLPLSGIQTLVNNVDLSVSVCSNYFLFFILIVIRKLVLIKNTKKI